MQIGTASAAIIRLSLIMTVIYEIGRKRFYFYSLYAGEIHPDLLYHIFSKLCYVIAITELSVIYD